MSMSLHTSGVAAGRHIDEWVPPGLHLLVSKVWVVSVLGLIVLLALPGRRPRPSEICSGPLLPASGVRLGADGGLVAARRARPIPSAQLAAVLPPRLLAEEDRDRTRPAGHRS